MSKAKERSVFVCQSCGASFQRWMGRCTTCGEWNTLVEERATKAAKGPEGNVAGDKTRAMRFSEVDEADTVRVPTGLKEFDRVLGGGAARSGVTLVGGDPGIGKSTLLLQTMFSLASRNVPGIYITGEEAASQVRARAERFGLSLAHDVRIQATNDLEDIEDTLRASIKAAPGQPIAVIVDSIQTVRSGALESAAGTVAQLREVTSRLVEMAKRNGLILFLIGHVTKDGAIAGPKVLEHLVDTVLSFEGDASRGFRIVRAIKNRFGPAHEMAVFDMTEKGLREIEDPSSLFLAERPEGASGSIVYASAEGSRPLLLEIQALVTSAAFGNPRRVVTGLDSARLAILLAVLDRRAGLHILDRDVFASVAGGAEISERGADLPIAIAVASSFRNKPIDADIIAMGELGLTGEVRSVPRLGLRLSEAKKMGFKRAIVPMANLEGLTKDERSLLKLAGVTSLEDALTKVF